MDRTAEYSGYSCSTQIPKTIDMSLWSFTVLHIVSIHLHISLVYRVLQTPSLQAGVICILPSNASTADLGRHSSLGTYGEIRGIECSTIQPINSITGIQLLTFACRFRTFHSTVIFVLNKFWIASKTPPAHLDLSSFPVLSWYIRFALMITYRLFPSFPSLFYAPYAMHRQNHY